MSSPGLPTLELDVRPRRAEPCLASLAICIAGAAPWLAGHGWKHLLLAVVAMTGCIVGLRLAGWLGGLRRIDRIAWRADGTWQLTDAGGRCYEAVLRTDSRVAASMLWLRWDARSGAAAKRTRRSMWLTAQDVPQQQLRRLGVRLRLAGCNKASDAIGQRRTSAT